MNLRNEAVAGLIALVPAIGAGTALADDGVTVGRHSPAEGGIAALHAHIDLPQPVGLEPSIFAGFPGYATGAFGFSNTQINEAAEDLFMLSESSSISAVLLELSGGLVINDGLHVMTPGDALNFGPPFFDYHPVFSLPVGGSGQARFVLHDASGIYSPSEEFVIAFAATNPHCRADIGAQGGVRGADGVLDNNDFIAFITLFFEADAVADQGVAGGLPGSDGAFDNNDFIAFIGAFFNDCGT